MSIKVTITLKDHEVERNAIRPVVFSAPLVLPGC